MGSVRGGRNFLRLPGLALFVVPDVHLQRVQEFLREYFPIWEAEHLMVRELFNLLKGGCDALRPGEWRRGTVPT